MTSRGLWIFCVIAAAGGLAFGFAWRGEGAAAGLALIIGLAWLLPELWPKTRPLGVLRAAWLPSLWLAALGLLSLGWIIGGGSWWLGLLSVSAGLAAWDLGAFRRRVFSGVSGRGTQLRAYYPAGGVGVPWSDSTAHSRENSTQPADDSPSLAPGRGDRDPSTTAAGSLPAEPQAAEHLAFDRAHLRALGRVSLAGLGGAGLLYLAAQIIHLPLNINLALGSVLLLVLILILLARLLARN